MRALICASVPTARRPSSDELRGRQAWGRPLSVPPASLQRGPLVMAWAAGFCVSQNCRKSDAPVVPGTEATTCEASWSIVRLSEKSRAVSVDRSWTISERCGSMSAGEVGGEGRHTRDVKSRSSRSSLSTMLKRSTLSRWTGVSLGSLGLTPVSSVGKGVKLCGCLITWACATVRVMTDSKPVSERVKVVMESPCGWFRARTPIAAAHGGSV
ncbi:hypothetical protein LRS03_17265 [Rhizobacter sp. J219]|uniref:hypothetical protein n=1 Tax=Rhizobacter sp. J219 TaxID=2898430 RepID=UPI00215115C2|nr:hypothetical protein [Rhizobacter sp. J219]MCR5884504.1 hypothetical protein [Rhizobacter sp. J219]